MPPSAIYVGRLQHGEIPPELGGSISFPLVGVPWSIMSEEPADAEGRSPFGRSRRWILQSIAIGLGLATTTAVESTPSMADKSQTDGRRSGGRKQTATSPPPGPPVLYDSLESAPSLRNGPNSRWSAEPLLVSGTDAYVDGEYLYQDFVYDDHGADTAPLSIPSEPNTNDNTTGDLRYPTDTGTYAYNATDLLEFRAMPSGEGIAYRIRLNTMLEPDVAGVTIGIDTGGGGRSEWGYGLGELGDLRLDHVITTWGSGAELDGEKIDSSVNLDRNSIQVEVPLMPGAATWRHYLVVGLFDVDQETFKQVGDRPTSTHPGGANGRDPPPVFNVGFRFDEPLDGGPDRPTDYREAAQATALADRDISQFYADIDFSKLSPPTTTEYHVRASGFLNRLYASRLDRGEGVDTEGGTFVGPVQPYAVYVPENYNGDAMPLHLDLHSGTNTHNDFGANMPNRVREFGEKRGAFVLTPLARGTRGFYLADHEYAVFEAWNDLAHRYNIDDRHVTIGGHSMGSYGTYKLIGSYPDLFAAAFTTTGAMGSTFTDRSAVTGAETPDVTRLTENLRHVPLMMWYGAADELVPVPAPLSYEQQLREHGYRHELDVFTADHFTWPQLDEWPRAPAFLDTHGTVTRAPARVTFRRIPAYDIEELGLVRDGAYWLSDIQVGPDESSGLVDAESGGIQNSDPSITDYESAGTEPLPYLARGTRWTTWLEDEPSQNRLSVTLESIANVTIWVEEADLDPRRPLELRVESTSRATVTLAGSFGKREITVSEGTTVGTIRLVRERPTEDNH